MDASQREELDRLLAETLSQKHVRQVREKQAACPHKTLDHWLNFVWCADCDFDLA